MTTPTTDPTPDRQWLKITLFCPSPLLEPAADLLGVLSGAGVEQSPETDHGALLSGFFPLADLAEQEAILARVEREMAELFALYGEVPGRPDTTLLADQDWATSWQQYFTPFAIVPGLVIKPSWEAYQPAVGEQVIEMDPGMAFGTGQHASTRLALTLIRSALAQGPAARALDVGTGTGILAMGAALFGVEAVVAIDNDPDAVAVARENVDNNGLTARIEVSGTPVEQVRGPFALVCANIIHDVLVDMAPVLAHLTAGGGHLVLAGVLAGAQEANIVTVYRAHGFSPAEQLTQDEWAGLRLVKTADPA